LCVGNNELEGSDKMIQIYTGNGKGKTTAALGLAVRAVGAGLKVFIGQFCKGKTYSELNILKKIEGIKVEQFGRRCFIKKTPTSTDIKLARDGLEKIKNIMAKRTYKVIILDEINIALHLHLLKIDDVLALIKSAPKNIEIILTGRYAPRRILEIADLASEIKEIRHYYKKGLRARRGIEH
jgi:cob(I)alamin adenosyltransferase